MSQFYFRFIRYTSTRHKDIYFLTYAGSIESNLMQMVLAKEKLNLFMKGQDVDLDEIYEKFDVDFDLISLLIGCRGESRCRCPSASGAGRAFGQSWCPPR